MHNHVVLTVHSLKERAFYNNCQIAMQVHNSHRYNNLVSLLCTVQKYKGIIIITDNTNYQFLLLKVIIALHLTIATILAHSVYNAVCTTMI